MSWQHDVRAIHQIVVKKWPAWGEEDRRFLALALAGEVGELLNLIKKDWRGDITTHAMGGWREKVEEEMADIRIYFELLAMAYQINLDDAVRNKLPELFNRWPEAHKLIRAGKCCVTHSTEDA